MVRPDGHVGFRSPSAEAAALAALDRHLGSYLIPDPTVGPIEEAAADLVENESTRKLTREPTPWAR
jgi:hypothetical protein